METIRQFLTTTYFTERNVDPSTQAFYQTKLHRFSTFLCREAAMSDLERETVNRFLAYRLTQVSVNTVRGERSTLLAIWNYAYEIGVLETRPSRIRQVKKELRQVEGWGIDQRRSLLAQIDKLEGNFQGKEVGRREFWRAVVLTLYDTGLRLGDLFNLDAAQLRGEGNIVVIQRKTRKPVEVSIGPEAWEAIKAIHPRTRKKPFGGVLCRHWFFHTFAELCIAAGLEGRTKRLRIASGSEVERLYPGDGHLHLGHATRSVFDAYYNDRRLSKRPCRLPPRFG